MTADIDRGACDAVVPLLKGTGGMDQNFGAGPSQIIGEFQALGVNPQRLTPAISELRGQLQCLGFPLAAEGHRGAVHRAGSTDRGREDLVRSPAVTFAPPPSVIGVRR